MSLSHATFQLSTMVKRMEEYIRQHQLFAPGEHLLVAVSGGPDSVALLHALGELAPKWRWRLSAVHVNYGLRGIESEEDADFVEALCRELKVRLFCESVSVPRIVSREEGTGRGRRDSLQARARAARYALFRCIASQAGADKVVLGHTADDQAETVVLWMLRGAGATGLAGIPQVREGMWIRPLLELSRHDVATYLIERGLRWRMDSSNAKPIYARNRIRLQLMPILKELNPSIVKVLGRQAKILRDEDHCLEQLAIEHLNGLTRHDLVEGAVFLEREAFMALPLALQRRGLRAVIRKVTNATQGPTFGAVESVRRRVIEGLSGSMLAVTGALVWRDYNRIGVRSWPARQSSDQRIDHSAEPVATHVMPGSVTAIPWAPGGQVIRLRLHDSLEAAGGSTGPATTTRAVLAADRIVMPIGLRSWRPGDWFQPAGMHGRRKKLQNFFVDLKLSRGDRCRVPLLVAGDQILWVIGHRVDYRVLPTSTSRRLLVAEVEAAPERGSGS